MEYVLVVCLVAVIYVALRSVRRKRAVAELDGAIGRVEVAQRNLAAAMAREALELAYGECTPALVVAMSDDEISRVVTAYLRDVKAKRPELTKETAFEMSDRICRVLFDMRAELRAEASG